MPIESLVVVSVSANGVPDEVATEIARKAVSKILTETLVLREVKGTSKNTPLLTVSIDQRSEDDPKVLSIPNAVLWGTAVVDAYVVDFDYSGVTAGPPVHDYFHRIITVPAYSRPPMLTAALSHEQAFEVVVRQTLIAFLNDAIPAEVQPDRLSP